MVSACCRALALALVGCSLCACASGYEACQKDAITGMEHCQPTSGNYGEAVATAGLASGAWAVAGCSINGCDPRYHCNEKTKMCERIHCEEGKGSCPAGFTCDPEKGICN